jgi:protein dithiol oxidoreductase (disulfide-forming)
MFPRTIAQALLGLMVAFQALAADEGIDYVKLKTPQATETGNKVEVLEVFWYGCPHCYTLEPFLDRWVDTMPEAAEFRRMPAVLGPHWEPHARAFYAAELLGVTGKLHHALFKAMHDEKRKILTREDLAAFAAEQGIDQQEFMDAYDSFFVNMKVRRATDLVQRYGIDGVPALVINGKYRTSATQTGGNARLMEVLDELVRRETGGTTAGGS